MQALKAADIQFGASESVSPSAAITPEKRKLARTLCARVRLTLKEQSDGWISRPLFERQWVIRDFKKTAGMPVEEWLDTLAHPEAALQGSGPIDRPCWMSWPAITIIWPSCQEVMKRTP
jgi:hypothetical protein